MPGDLKSAENRQILIDVLDTYEDCRRLKTALDLRRVTHTVFYRIKRANPDLADRYDLILKDVADSMLHRAADIADNLFSDDSTLDPRRARVGLDGTFQIAKYMDRARFGDHVQIEATHNVSLNDAISAAKQRALPNPTIIEGTLSAPAGDAVNDTAPVIHKRLKSPDPATDN